MAKVAADVSSIRLRRNVTLKDVAVAAGVTPMTVSNVLNGRAGQVSADTTQKVVAAIERMGYRPHAVGRRLRDRRTLSIGVLILDDVPQFLGDPFTTQIVAGLANVATDSGYSLVLQGMRSDAVKDPPLLAQLQTDGMCALLSGPEPRRRALIERLAGIGLPLVLIQEQKAPAGVCCIRQDDRGGARAVARHVLERGARRLMMLVPSGLWPAITMRERGVRAECKAFGAELTLVPVRGRKPCTDAGCAREGGGGGRTARCDRGRQRPHGDGRIEVAARPGHSGPRTRQGVGVQRIRSCHIRNDRPDHRAVPGLRDGPARR